MWAALGTSSQVMSRPGSRLRDQSLPSVRPVLLVGGTVGCPLASPLDQVGCGRRLSWRARPIAAAVASPASRSISSGTSRSSSTKSRSPTRRVVVFRSRQHPASRAACRTSLRSFTHGHVKQLHAVARRFLPQLARHTPLLPGADQVAYVDIDDTIRRTYGYAKQGAGYGYSKVKGLNALLGIVSTPLSAPVIAATRLRKGPSNSARGAAAFVAETIRTARACGASGLLVVRADSAFYATLSRRRPSWKRDSANRSASGWS